MMLEDGGLDLAFTLAGNIDHKQNLSRGQRALKGIEFVTVLLAAEQRGHQGSETRPRRSPGK